MRETRCKNCQILIGRGHSNTKPVDYNGHDVCQSCFDGLTYEIKHSKRYWSRSLNDEIFEFVKWKKSYRSRKKRFGLLTETLEGV